jgi:hypothetical protein
VPFMVDGCTSHRKSSVPAGRAGTRQVTVGHAVDWPALEQGHGRPRVGVDGEVVGDAGVPAVHGDREPPAGRARQEVSNRRLRTVTRRSRPSGVQVACWESLPVPGRAGAQPARVSTEGASGHHRRDIGRVAVASWITFS